MSDVRQIKGVFLPAPTPFDTEGAVDEALFAAMLDFYVRSGVNALFVLGSFGQGATLDSSQRKRAFEVAAGAVADRIPLVPDVGMVDPYRSRELAMHARSAGATAIAMVAPYYYTDRTPDEIIKHFEMVEEPVNLPLFIYNNPVYQGYSISPALLSDIRGAVPQLAGMAHGGDSMASILSYKNTLGDNFKIFSSALNLFPGMLAGVSGALAPPLAFAPAAGVALVAAIERGDYAEATRIQVALMDFIQQIGALHRWFRAAQHEALRHLGFPVARFPRWPTADLPEDAGRRIRNAIDTLNGQIRAAG